jgi:hypothetical protein
MSAIESIPTEQLSTISLETIKMRLSAVKESVNRARFAFLVSTIASLTLIIAAWNAYGSWYRDFALREVPYASQATSVVDEAQKQIISEWVKNQTIAINLLGIRIGISDAAIVGALGLWVIAIWLYFSMRRANRAIGFLLFETQTSSCELQLMIFVSIATSMVFSDIGGGDQPIDNLKELPSKDNYPIVRKAVRLLFYLPVFTIFSIVFIDGLSIFLLSSPFRDGHRPLWYALKGAPIQTWVQVVVWEGVAIGLGILTYQLCRKTVAFEEAIGKVIQEYLQLSGLNKLMSISRKKIEACESHV